MAWQVQEAKQRFSELVRRALTEGPQVVTRHGEPAVVVIAVDQYERLRGQPADLAAFLLDPAAPRFDDLDLDEVRRDLPRDVDL
jgi:antitoxin Phd